MKTVLLFLLVMSANSCSPTIRYEGNSNIYDENTILQIKKGVTTDTQIIELFGAPQTRAKQGYKQEMLYQFIRTEQGWNYVDSGVYGLHIFFERGVVVDYSTNSSGNYFKDKN